MKLTFKDLKQQKFQIDAEPSETIGAVKDKISKEKGWEPSTQKLIYSGKILQDDNTIESYKIEEKGFIVCMTSKVRIRRVRRDVEYILMPYCSLKQPQSLPSLRRLRRPHPLLPHHQRRHRTPLPLLNLRRLHLQHPHQPRLIRPRSMTRRRLRSVSSAMQQ